MGGPMYKNAAWHYNHFMDPQKMNEESIMPNYAWLAVKNIDLSQTPKKIRAMQTLGVPYEEGYDEKAVDDLLAQAQGISDELKASGIEIDPKKQMVAMIAYMHKLGRDISTTTEPVKEDTVQTTNAKEVQLLNNPEDLAAGKQLFQSTCVACHGADGKGIATFPNLTDDEWIHGNTPAAVFHQISEGNVAKGMIPYKNMYNEKQITQLASYILITLQNEDSK